MGKRYPEPRHFYPRNPQKYKGDPTQIIMRSSWETRFAHWADTNPSIVAWNSERVLIPYISPRDGRQHTYYVDFWVQVRNRAGATKSYLIEIKPLKECFPPDYSSAKRHPPMQKILEEELTYKVNQAKWDSAKRFARQRGAEFMVLTERELGLERRR